MRSVKLAVLAVATCVGLAAASANAEQVASVSSCLSVAQQVKTALDSNAQSSSYQDAMKERNYGLEFCNAGFYAKGITHYNRALELLGVAQKADATMNH
jgi:hypothetical protein